jgi:hypothetical protein
MAQYAHKGQILPLVNQMIPIDKQTTFHASYDYHLNGMNQGDIVYPLMPLASAYFNGSTKVQLTRTIQDDFTIEAWIKTTGVGTGTAHYQTLPILHSETSGLRPDFGFGINSAGKLVFGDGNTTADYNVTSTGSVNDGKWHHVAATRTLSTGAISLYIDGVADGTGTGSTVSLTANPNMYIAYGEDGASYFTGNIAEVRTWSRVLSANEISTYKNMQLAGNESGLVGYWKLTEKEGIVVFDTCCQHDGVLTGTRTYDYGNTLATVQKSNIKFGGAVLLEPDTKNLFNGSKSNNGGEISQSTNGAWEVITALIDNGNMGRRHFVDLTNLTNAYTYTCSIMVYNPGATVVNVHQDWCDMGNTSTAVNPGEMKRISIVTSRSTYDSTFRFYDVCPLKTNDVIWIKDPQIEFRDYPTSYVAAGVTRPVGKLWYDKSVVNPSAFTISCWFNIPWMHRDSSNPPNGGIQGNWYHPIIEIATPTNTSQSLGLAAGPVPASFNRNLILQVPGGVTANFPIQDNTWYHMVITYDGTTYKVYINGTQQISYTGAAIAPAAAEVLMVGGGYRGKPLIYIDEIRIESRAISTDEVSAWASSGLHYNYLDYSYYVD